VIVMLALLLMWAPGSAQELEPGAYWPIPKGLNIATVVNRHSAIRLALEPGRIHDDRREPRLDRRRLQLSVGALSRLTSPVFN
jgi:hypothetical protein